MVLDVLKAPTNARPEDAGIPPSSNGKGRDGKGGMIPFIMGRVSSLGRPSDRQPAAFIQQTILAFLLEAWDHSDVRANAPRHGLVFPDWGRTMWPPAAQLRFKTPFLFLPIEYLDLITAYVTVKGKKRGKAWRKLRKVQFLQPYWLSKITRKRLFALWAVCGPLHDLLTAEGRNKVLEQYPGFDPMAKTNFKLIRRPWFPTSADMYKVMNPVLAKVPAEKIAQMSRDELEALVKKLGGEDKKLVEWFPMSGFLQNSYLEYLAVLVGGGGLEVVAAWNPYKTVPDPHVNDRFGTVVHTVANMKTNECGLPVQLPVSKETGLLPEEGEGEEEDEQSGRLFGTVVLKTSQLKQLIDTPEAAKACYELTKGHRYDFDPDPTHYRSLDGELYPRANPALGIVSDTERMSEVLRRKPFLRRLLLSGPVKAFRNLFLRSRPSKGNENGTEKPEGNWGPSHSATELVAEMPAEEMVYLGKYLRHRKILSKIRRHWAAGILTEEDVAAEVSRWLCTAVPEMAQKAVADARVYIPFVEFWSKFSDPKRGNITSFLLTKVGRKEFESLLEGAPTPADFWELCASFEYFCFDPIECWYGYDADGLPRLPEELLDRLVKDPTLRGINLALDGRGVLEIYLERPGMRRQVIGFWLREVPADRRLQTIHHLVRTRGLEYLTMAFALFRPMDKDGETERGLLHELWISQSTKPVLQWVDEEYERQRMWKEFFVWPNLEPRFIDLPVEVIMRMADELDATHAKCDFRIALFARIKAQGKLKQAIRGWQAGDAQDAVVRCKYGARINKSRSRAVYIEGQRAIFQLYDLAWRCKQRDLQQFWVRSVMRNPLYRNDQGKVMGSCSSQMAAGLHPEFALGGLELILGAGILSECELEKIFAQEPTAQEKSLEVVWEEDVEELLRPWPTEVVQEEMTMAWLGQKEAGI